MITFKETGADWQRQGAPSGLSQMQLVNLKIKMVETINEIDGLIDEVSAEGAIKREVARRMRNIAAQAQAAGQMSQMWNDQNNRFYKQRVAINRGF